MKLATDLDRDLCLEEVDVLGEVEGVLAGVSDHVCVQNVVCCLKDAGQVRLIYGALQWDLQQPHQQVDHLCTE